MMQAERNPRTRAWLEIRLQDIQHNADVLQRALPEGCKVMAVVKADAYGHGAVRIALALQEKVHAFGVATIDEGIQLRENGVKGLILLLGYTHPDDVLLLQKYALTATVVDEAHANALSARQVPIDVHVKVDTGMHRLGEDWRHTEAFQRICEQPYLHVTGVYTHLCAADCDEAFTKVQLERFQQIEVPGVRHAQSSYGMLNFPQMGFAYARVGIALYGMLSSPKDTTLLQPDLRPALSLRARVACIRQVAEGETVGYGRAFTAPSLRKIAVLCVGYADGIPRAYQGGALIHGVYAPVVGRICMDQMTVDITDIEDVMPGDIATLIGKDGMRDLPATEVAEKAGTITNELLSRLGARLKRIYDDESEEIS